MSDLKKILKEEYAKKKLNITPKLLMEMIEEVMLAEATMTRKDFATSDTSRGITLFKQMVANGDEFLLSDGSKVVIVDDDKVLDLINRVDDERSLRGLRLNTKDGRTITPGSIQKTGTPFSTSGGKKGPGGNVSEKFEGNIIIALGGGSIPKGLSHIDKVKYPAFQNAADELVKNVDDLKPGVYFKPGNGIVTELYKQFGSSNPTPKTDIANQEETDRISVKKEGASFLSAEQGETRALIAAALGLKDYDTLRNDSEMNTFFVDLAEDLSKVKWNDPDVDRRKLGDDALVKIYNKVLELMTIPEFQRKLATEAMTGEHRFTDKLSKANKLLVWKGTSGNGYYTDLKNWVGANADQFKYDIRWRGEGRSAGGRIDSVKKGSKAALNLQNRINDRLGISEGEIKEFVGDEKKFASQIEPRLVKDPPKDAKIGNVEWKEILIQALSDILLESSPVQIDPVEF